MTTGRTGRLLQHLRRSALLREGPGLSDAHLLGLFADGGDESAFEVLVRRHGPMVLGVCRRALRDHHDAEDAFQAVFLVLAKKAGSIARREALANWLYGVAHQTARKARALNARRRGRERQVDQMPERAAGPPRELWDDLRPLLDEELSALPEKYRAPLVLCDLEGRTRREAAAALGWTEGTLSWRLARARELLAGRLTRRGVVLSSGALVGLLARDAAAGWVPAALASSTARVAGLLGTGDVAAGALSARVFTLAQGVLRTMALGRMKVLTAALLAAGLLAGGAGGVAGLGGRGDERPAKVARATRTEQLIKQLGSESFAEREAASKALEALGEPALDALRRAAAGAEDLEVRRRAERLVRAIERRWQLACFTGHADAVPHVALSRDGRLALSTGRSENVVRVWDVKGGKEVGRFEGHTSWVWAAAFCPDGKRALSGGADRTVRLWEVKTGKEVRRFEGHGGQVVCVACSPDGKRALSGCQADPGVYLWDVEKGKLLRRFEGHAGDVGAVAFSRDGKRVLSGGSDATVRLWDAKTGKELRTFKGHTKEVGGVVFSPDGKKALSGAVDGTVRLWDVETGKELRRFAGHAGQVCEVAFSPDGRRALSGGVDRTLRLWDVATGKELRRFNGHAGSVSGVTFFPDGRRALSGSYDSTVRLWQLPR